MSSLSENQADGFRLSANGSDLAETMGLSEKGSGLAETNALSENPTAKPDTVPGSEHQVSSGGQTRAAQTRPGGRPRKPPSERRTRTYLVSANQAEAEIIETAAAAVGLKPAVYLRQAGTGTRLAKRQSELVYHRLSRVGVRLQQLARQVGADGRTDEQAELEALLQEVARLRAEL